MRFNTALLVVLFNMSQLTTYSLAQDSVADLLELRSNEIFSKIRIIRSFLTFKGNEKASDEATNLMIFTRDQNKQVRIEALNVLGIKHNELLEEINIQADSTLHDQVIEAISICLDDKYDSVKRAAIEALANIGVRAKALKNKIAEMLTNVDNESLHRTLAKALGQMDSNGSTLEEIVTNCNVVSSKVAAIEALGFMNSNESLPLIAKYLYSVETELIIASMFSLSCINVHDETILNKIEQSAYSENEKVRAVAIRTLTNLFEEERTQRVLKAISHDVSKTVQEAITEYYQKKREMADLRQRNNPTPTLQSQTKCNQQSQPMSNSTNIKKHNNSGYQIKSLILRNSPVQDNLHNDTKSKNSKQYRTRMPSHWIYYVLLPIVLLIFINYIL